MRQLRALFSFSQLEESQSVPPYFGDVWLPDLQVMAAREKPGASAGLYLAAKGGHNAESHNHNDVGQFLLYLDGEPVLIDPGVEEYTSKTFGSNRYALWTMQSAYHNLPTVNGCLQEAGRNFKAIGVHYQASEDRAELSLQLEDAYPQAAGVARWQRRIALCRT